MTYITYLDLSFLINNCTSFFKRTFNELNADTSTLEWIVLVFLCHTYHDYALVYPVVKDTLYLFVYWFVQENCAVALLVEDGATTVFKQSYNEWAELKLRCWLLEQLVHAVFWGGGGRKERVDTLFAEVARHFFHVNLVDANVLDRSTGNRNNLHHTTCFLHVFWIRHQKVTSWRCSWLSSRLNWSCLGYRMIKVWEGLVWGWTWKLNGWLVWISKCTCTWTTLLCCKWTRYWWPHIPFFTWNIQWTIARSSVISFSSISGLIIRPLRLLWKNFFTQCLAIIQSLWFHLTKKLS